MRSHSVGLMVIAALSLAAAYWHTDVLAAVSNAGPAGAPTVSRVSSPANRRADAPLPNPAAKGPPALTVKTGVATAGSLHFHRQTVGWLVSPASINLTSPLQGLVAELVAKEGDVLKKGDLV